MNYKIVHLNDKEYPEKLKRIYNPPEYLYWIGYISLLSNTSIAIIGCRNASEYGIKIASIFSNNISKAGVTIISGLARGIDSIAHKSSVKEIGKTIAVMGCGVDIIYPLSNKNIYEDIINNGGLIISEFPLGTNPSRESFPKRNRIISALSDGVLVIEAKKRSGTMITVDYSLEQGKNVYAIPGNIDSPNSVGTNELIKQGAIMVTNYKEILRDYIIWMNTYMDL